MNKIMERHEHFDENNRVIVNDKASSYTNSGIFIVLFSDQRESVCIHYFKFVFFLFKTVHVLYS